MLLRWINLWLLKIWGLPWQLVVMHRVLLYVQSHRISQTRGPRCVRREVKAPRCGCGVMRIRGITAAALPVALAAFRAEQRVQNAGDDRHDESGEHSPPETLDAQPEPRKI